jgi:hypothetical protein
VVVWVETLLVTSSSLRGLHVRLWRLVVRRRWLLSGTRSLLICARALQVGAGSWRGLLVRDRRVRGLLVRASRLRALRAGDRSLRCPLVGTRGLLVGAGLLLVRPRTRRPIDARRWASGTLLWVFAHALAL